jgi:DNA-binding MarR family transcriptional regulator
MDDSEAVAGRAGHVEEMAELRLDELLCFPLYATARAVTRRYGELLGAVGLTYPQYLTLLVLWQAEEPLSVGALGRHLHLDSGTLTPLLKRLEALGLVDRRRDVEDERRVLVAPTEAGRAMRARVADVPGRLAADLGLTRREAEDLRGRLTRLLDHLDEQADEASGGART